MNTTADICLICGNLLDFVSKSGLCGSENCDYKAETLQILQIYDYIKNDPEVSLFLLKSSFIAFRSNKKEMVYEPCQEYMFETSDKYKRGDVSTLSGDVIKKDFTLINQITKNINVNEMFTLIQSCENEEDIKNVLGNDLYCLVHFIITSNKTKMIRDNIFQTDALNKSITHFKIIHRPEIEEAFNRQNAKSMLVFHGSSSDCWHSILRNGLKVCSNTKMMANAASYGKGIYISPSLQTSYGYIKGSDKIFAVCEVIDNDTLKKPVNQIYVETEEQNILLRYIFDMGSIITNIDKINEHFNKIIHKPLTEKENKGNKRLMKEYIKMQDSSIHDLGIRVELVSESDIHVWHIYVYNFTPDTEVYKDFQKYNISAVQLEVIFPQNYPFDPPFIRIISPRFQFRTGHITCGGSICMELLTPQNWSPAYNIESVIIQIKALIIEGGGKLDTKYNVPYSLKEAKDAFERVSRAHGWF